MLGANSTFKTSNSKYPQIFLLFEPNMLNLYVWWFEIGALVELWTMYVTQSMCVNIWKLGISYLAKYELHCFSNFLYNDPTIAKILLPYILEMNQFHCMETKSRAYLNPQVQKFLIWCSRCNHVPKTTQGLKAMVTTKKFALFKTSLIFWFFK